MIHEDRPSLEEALAHHGIKGMRWGVRSKVSNSLTPARKAKLKSEGKKLAIEVGTATLVAAGVAVTAHVLATNGHLPLTSFAKSLKTGVATTTGQKVTSAAGQKAVTTLSSKAWSTKVSSLSSDIASANASQDAWMRSIGLGKVVNNAH